MKLPHPIFILLLGCTVVLAARAADDRKSLNGIWRPTAAELGGRPLPPAVLGTITLKLDGPNYEVVVDTEKGKSVDRGTVELDHAASPKGMTVTGVEGPNAGKTYPAIYELKDDALRICYDLSGTKRPAEFKTAPGTKLYLVTYQRGK